MTPAPRIILASASPRRANLLTQMGLSFEISPSHIPEELLPGEDPETHACRLSLEKGREVWESHRNCLIIAGDTVVVGEGKILGKPVDVEDAVAMLMSLSGRTHTVVSGLALVFPSGEAKGGTLSTQVTFRHFGAEIARAYAETGEPMDKAGSYGIQGMGSTLVEGIRGDYHTVVGLPIPLLLDLLGSEGWTYEFGRLVPAGEGRNT